MRAEILSIGTELLLGQIVDTNANYLAGRLALLGIDCLHMQTVGDNLGRARGLGYAAATDSLEVLRWPAVIASSARPRAR